MHVFHSEGILRDQYRSCLFHEEVCHDILPSIVGNSFVTKLITDRKVIAIRHPNQICQLLSMTLFESGNDLQTFRAEVFRIHTLCSLKLRE